MSNEIRITNEEEFLNFFDRIDDEEYMKEALLEADNLSVFMKFEGENYNSSLTGTMIQALADYQERIYHIYRTQKYGPNSNKKLSDEEKRALEIKVDIKPGCTEAIVSFVRDIIPEVVNKMNSQDISNTIITVAGIIIVVWAVKGVGVTLIKEAFKTKREDIKNKLEQAKSEKEKAFLESIQSITNNAIEGMRSVASGITVASPERVTIGTNEITTGEAQNLLEDMKKPRAKPVKDEFPDMYSVDGEFKVLNINYEKDVTMMKALHIESNTVYDNISLMDGWLTEESMNILKNAQERDPVKFRILLTRDGKSKNFLKAIDVNSIGK